MIKITVDSEEEKQELLTAIYHIHGADINTDIPMVNELVHLYHNPERILVVNPYKEPPSHGVTQLDNGDIVYDDSVWWDFEGWNKGQNPVRTNWDDPLNLRLVFDKHGNLKDAKTLCYFGNFTITKETE